MSIVRSTDNNSISEKSDQQGVWGYAPTSKIFKNSGNGIFEYGVNG